MVCVAGCFDVIVSDGLEEARFHLNRPSVGLYVPPMIWDTEINFSPQSVCLVLASDYYDESDYYREYDDYLAAVTTARARLARQGVQSSSARYPLTSECDL